MGKKRKEPGGQPEVKRLDELEPECQTIIAKFRGEDYEPLAFETAMEQVNRSTYKAACGILRLGFGRRAAALADNARHLWWEFMTNPGGGFFRYDRSRPFAPYGYKTLERICLGRENLRDQFDRKITARDPDDQRRNPHSGTGRRTVPLDFDPVDHRSTDRAKRLQTLAETVAEMLAGLSADQSEVLILLYLEGANLSAVARARGISAQTLHMRVHKARETLRQRYPEFQVVAVSR